MDRTTRGLLVAFGVLLVVALGFSILTGGMMGPSMMGPGMMGSGMMGSGMMAPGMMSGQGWMRGLGMGLGGPAMLTFWGALIVGVVVLVRVLGTGPRTSRARAAARCPQAALRGWGNHAGRVRTDASGARTGVTPRRLRKPRRLSPDNPPEF